MDAWKEPATLLRHSEPKHDPLGVAYRSGGVQEIPLPPVLAATTQSSNQEGRGEDYGTREAMTVYWDNLSGAHMSILPGDRIRLRGDVYEPVGYPVVYPLGVYLRLCKEEPREH
mgnify:CR=1 FL=1